MNNIKNLIKEQFIKAFLFVFFSSILFAGIIIAVSWPSNPPTGETPGGKFMNFFNNMLVSTSDSTEGTVKKSASLGNEGGNEIVTLNGTNIKVAGSVQIGSDLEACDLNKAGATRYNSDELILEYCDGTNWLPIGSGGGGGGWVLVNKNLYSGNSPTTRTELDLSPYIGKKETLVMMKMKNNAISTGIASNGDNIRFRAKGDTDNIGINGTNTYGGVSSAPSDSGGYTAYAIMSTNSSGVIEYKGYGRNIDLILYGYIAKSSEDVSEESTTCDAIRAGITRYNTSINKFQYCNGSGRVTVYDTNTDITYSFTCDSSTKFVTKYNTSLGKYQYCNGSTWVTISDTLSCNSSTKRFTKYNTSIAKFQYCNGSSWVTISDTLSCNSSTKRFAKYNTSVAKFQYCNGSSWVTVNDSVHTFTAKLCRGNGRNYTLDCYCPSGYTIVSGGCNLDGTGGNLNSSMALGASGWRCESQPGSGADVEEVNIVCKK